MTLGDVQGKNDYYLVLVDESQTPNRLKLLKGLDTIAESVLYDTPAGIISFISDPVFSCLKIKNFFIFIF